MYFSAPEDTVGDLVNQIRRESEIPGTAEPKPEMKDSGKKSIIPKTVVSAAKSELDRVYDLLTSGKDLQMNPDGTLSPASAPKKARKARAGQRAESAGEDEKGDHSAHGGLRARKGHRGRPYRASAQGA